MRTRWFIALLALAVSMGARPVWADDDENGDGLGERLFELQLLRVAEWGPTQLPLGTTVFFTAAVTDPLEEGSIVVRRRRQVEVRLNGATADTVYRVFFCGLGVPPGGCLSLGTVQTNGKGDARGRLPFTATQRLWAGTFMVTRDATGTNQFVAGFAFPAVEPVQTGVEVEFKGRVDTLVLANGSFRLRGLPMDIFTGTSTRFDKVSGLSGLRTNDEVEVRGFTRPDGSIFASRVKVENDGGEGDDR